MKVSSEMATSVEFEKVMDRVMMSGDEGSLAACIDMLKLV